LALLPLVLEERAQGVLAIRFLGSRRFDEQERELLAQLAALVALAFRNALQLGELERRADRFALLAQAQQQLTQLTSQESLPQAVAAAVYSVIPCEVIEVLANGANGLQRVLHMEAGRVISTEPFPLQQSLLAVATEQTGVARLASHLAAGTDVDRGTMELCAAVRFGQRSAGVIRLLDANGDAALSIGEVPLAMKAAKDCRPASPKSLPKKNITLRPGATPLTSALPRASTPRGPRWLNPRKSCSSWGSALEERMPLMEARCSSVRPVKLRSSLFRLTQKLSAWPSRSGERHGSIVSRGMPKKESCFTQPRTARAVLS
jgi:hypothetical protein